ncbi:BamA/TamA family outer membrane protein [Maribellus maritimus]|uniref:BamA/TamA family outer membrane protein n=1 Tax=Maribellus maritimus TaxID=2870838 RepID=UPI001EEA5CCE|nr:BamA/TamA family outer membrane protein [Maribellus maritimus]MCG6187287.1 BamA/TamA family outer membrane protein [Maribellus maritimus]
MGNKRKEYITIFTFLFCVLFQQAAVAQKIFYSAENREWPGEITEPPETKLYSIFLIGDLKHPIENINLELLKNKLDNEGEKSALVVLGDIVYPRGLPDKEEPGFEESLRRHEAILNRIKEHPGKIVFLSGNHDWANGGKEGWESVIQQEEFIESFLDRGNTYLPDEGCPGPVEIDLTEDITLIVVNSQWWFHRFEKPELDDDCDIEDENDLYIQIEDAIRRNTDKKIVFATHHPLFSVGNHGGYFPFLMNIFPFMEAKPPLYIPLPGFIYTGHRKYFGDPQDLANPDYKLFKQNLLEILEKYPNVIYAAGHEHNLQYFQADSLHHIVSGGGGEGTFIAEREKEADFAAQSVGFAQLSFYKNGDVWLQFFSPQNNGSEKLLFNKKLYSKPLFSSEKTEATFQDIDFTDSIVHEKLTDLYQIGKVQRFLMGENYREVWSTAVDFPVFDIEAEKGGLSIIKRGGGQQTRSVRLEDKDGKQYVLRSVNKFVEKALSKEMQNTIAVDVVQDGISASHPYAAVTIPKLADAAGVMHTNPKLVWVTDDPRLGIYRKDIANDIFLFEERPAGNRKDIQSFGYSKDIVNTAETIKKTNDKHDHMVDQKAVLRARLLDILLNDWDRHDDQWRWATFNEDGVKIYKPIPRDRDQVYFVNEGPLMWVASRKWVVPKFQGFDSTIKNVVGLGFNSRYFDRAFLSEPDLQNWIEIAEDIKTCITDSVIHEAISELPPGIYAKSGKEIEEKLKSRRDLLPKYADEFYRFLSKEVDVVGTDERDLFLVERQQNGNTKVEVFALSDKKGKVKEKLYERTFLPDETKEIRLYGLKDEDEFELSGEAEKGIKIRIIGGKDKDKVKDKSIVKGLSKKTIVYERKDKKNKLKPGSETRMHLSSKKSIDNYNRKQFKFDKTMPLITGGYNIDDGVFLGSGVSIKNYNFRDSSFHQFTGKVAFLTGAFELAYKGLVTSVSQIFDFKMDANISIPRSVDNYYGPGNETQKITDSKRFYRVRYIYGWLNPALYHQVNKSVSYSMGAFYQYYDVTDTTERFVGQLYPGVLPESAYNAHHFTGINANFTIDTRDDETIPQRGIYWKTEAGAYHNLKSEGKNFMKLQSDLSLYLSFQKDPRFVFAFRFGGATNVGDYEFFHSNFLGRKANLRGFRSNRFAGDQSFYQNTEFRVKLKNIHSYLFNGQAGMLLFNDIGRVWTDGENSNRWHQGYGGGLWISPFNAAAVTITYGKSKEDNLIDFTLSYLF